jgi:hypothetical protein
MRQGGVARGLIACAVLLGTGCTGGAEPRVSASVRTTTSSTAPTPRPGPRSITELAMDEARAVHTATRLEDGTVLVAGGFGAGEGDVFASTEVYSPGDAFTDGPAMTVPRYGHTATLLRDGRVLIAGGFGTSGEVLDSAELYDPATGSFSATGSLGLPRADQTATLLQDGRVLIAGGITDGVRFLASAELFDPGTGRFARTGSMLVARESQTATLLEDGSVLIAGGHRGRHEDIELFDEAERYVPAASRFEPTGSMTISRHKHDAVLLADGRVLIVGGDDAADQRIFDSAETYDPRTGRFSAAGRMTEHRYKFAGTSIALPGGLVLLSSGASTPELFDPRTGRFTAMFGTLGVTPLFAAAARVGPRAVLVTGGYSTTGPATSDAWLIRA